jgi:hypothetical protein
MLYSRHLLNSHDSCQLPFYQGLEPFFSHPLLSTFPLVPIKLAALADLSVMAPAKSVSGKNDGLKKRIAVYTLPLHHSKPENENSTIDSAIHNRRWERNSDFIKNDKWRLKMILFLSIKHTVNNVIIRYIVYDDICRMVRKINYFIIFIYLFKPGDR